MTGPEWKGGYDAYFDWCMTASNGAISVEMERRSKLLDQCLAAKTAPSPDTAARPSAEPLSRAVRAPSEEGQFEPEEVYRPVDVIPVGKWPEGIAFDGTSLWVAESGRRRIAQIDLRRRRVVRRHKVGRLPVEIVSGSDGRVFALVHTDRKVWLQKGRSGRIFARLKECPESMAGDEDTLWVLAWVNCTSSLPVLYAIDVDSRRVREFMTLRENGFDIALAGEQIWTVHPRGQTTTISRIDPPSGQALDLQLDGVRLHSIGSNGERVFAVGLSGQQGAVVAVGGRETDIRHELILDERISAVTATGSHVAAFGEGGTVWVLSAENLAIERVITTDYGPFSAKSALALDNVLYVTVHSGQGGNGSVLVIHDWEPGGGRVAARGAAELPAQWRSSPYSRGE